MYGQVGCIFPNPVGVPRLKTNLSPDNWWSEGNSFPFEYSLVRGHLLIFGGVPESNRSRGWNSSYTILQSFPCKPMFFRSFRIRWKDIKKVCHGVMRPWGRTICEKFGRSWAMLRDRTGSEFAQFWFSLRHHPPQRSKRRYFPRKGIL